MLALPSDAPHGKMVLDKLAEYGPTGGKLPIVGNGWHWATPERVANGCSA